MSRVAGFTDTRTLEENMRRPLLIVLVLLACATNTRAAEIDGKWGLGVGAGGVLGTNPEFSIFHGHSKTTGWLLDFRLSGYDVGYKESYVFGDTLPPIPSQSSNRNEMSLFAGPRIRRFTRPDAEFSPYVDFFLHGTYSRLHAWTGYGGGLHRNSTRSGVAGGIALGAEYFTHWHFSVAAHSDLAQLSWAHFRDEDGSASVSRVLAGHETTASFSVQPTMVLRVYF